MKCFGLWVNLLLLPLPVRSWWCETSNRTGCRGQSRHFVRAASDTNPFLAFQDIETGFQDEPIVVDWDNDGDLDVILRGTHELSLFEFTSGNQFVKMEGGPFEGIFSSYCRPAVVDWNKDGRLDLIVGTEDGIKYYETQRGGRLLEKEKEDNPFGHIYTEKGACTDLAVADWDADGNFDVLVSTGSLLSLPMRHFEESNGKLMLVDNSTSPFQSVIEKTHTMRPLMEDWDGDGRMDLILMAKVLKRSIGQWFGSSCSVEVHLQLADGTASAQTTFDLVLWNLLCMKFKGSGLSLVDVDQDGDKDAVIGGFDGPLKVFERTSTGLTVPRASASDSIPLDAIDLGAILIFNINAKLNNDFHPVLADWDLDGDLDLALVSDGATGDDGEEVKPRYFEHQADDTVIELSGPPNISCPILWNRHFSFVDFDGDGKKDIVGFDSEDFGVNICIQTPSGFKLLEAEENPFRGLSSSLFPYRQEGQSNVDFGNFGLVGHPTFLDWDGDGDLDMLKIIAAEEVYVCEQFSNGTFLAHALGVPKARDYIAADFDGDGDVDITIIKPSGDSYLYFERRSDGSLEELFDTDNPFNAVGKNTGGNTMNTAKTQLSTLGDWNGDGEMDMILVDRSKVRLFINSPSETFLEVHRRDNPFTLVKNALTKKTAVSLVDVNSDGKLDVVLPPSSILQVLNNGYETYKYFQQTDGVLVEQRGSANPFGKLELDFTVAWTTTYLSPMYQAKNVVVDLDGDGDLDIVHANLAYSRNDNGKFKILEVGDPVSPFYGIDDNFRSFWTFVDLDVDGNLDLVQAYQPFPVPSPQYMSEVTQEMIRNGTSKEIHEAWVNSMLGATMRFYRQVRNGSNYSFSEVQGAESPFHDIGYLDTGSLRPQMVDFDGDGDLDLVLGTDDGNLLYFEQDGGKFRPAAANPFAGLSLYQAPGEESWPVQPYIVDWDGDGSLDLVVTGTDNVQFFQRGVCMPSSPYCRSGTCDQQLGQCKCFPDSKGEDCSLCGDFHVRKQGGGCSPCPGYGDMSSTCNRRGKCYDDADARASRIASNHSGFKVTEATGTGKCTCSEPFNGSGCQEGACPPGKRLDLDAPVDMVSRKYPLWEVCVPCQSGRFKNFSGNTDCEFCPAGHKPEAGIRCVPCEAGTFPSAKNRSECGPCDVGYVAAAGRASCTPCLAGTAPNEDKSICVKCPPGAVSRSRDGECTQCQAGWVPEDSSKSGCRRCTGQNYASEGDEACRPCTFPYMILNEDNQCTVLYTVLFALAFLLSMLLVSAIFGRLRLHCLKRRLNSMVAAKNWQELHATQSTFLKYGLWKHTAATVVEDRKLQVKKTSFQLGISLQYVFEHLQDVYKAKADEAEWRLDEWGPVTKSGFFVKTRNCNPQVDPLAAWNALPPCVYPEDPNFHQVAGLLAYGPLALGKNQRCPRDGLMDCSIVDALEAESNSGTATWFLSWVWGYHFTTVFKALSRWWERHKMVSSAGESGNGQGVYIWWCVFVNNQFRMLEAGQVEEPGDLFTVFGDQLSGIGKMLMCLDKMRSSSYTTRIWCIFEVFVACQRSIPTTVILPELEVDAIEYLKDLTEQCRVDAEKAKASVEADAIAIKKHIQEKHQSFGYVNETVERALWCEVIAFLEQKDQSTAGTGEPSKSSKEQSEGTTQSIAVSETASQLLSTRDLEDMSSTKSSKRFKRWPWCNLQ